MTNNKEPFIGKKIVVFTAHPDDEGIAAGTMHKNHKAGGETFLICATYGEKGKSHLPKPVSDAALKKIRKNELLAAAKILHVHHVLFLGFPDAGVKQQATKLFKKSLPIIQKIKPDYILSFGPDGMSAHWDHITVGKTALKIAKKLKIPLYAFTVSDEFRKAGIVKRFLSRRKFGKYAGIPEHRQWDTRVEVDLATKRRAMKSHKSQFGDRGPMTLYPKNLVKKMFSYEHFIKEKI